MNISRGILRDLPVAAALVFFSITQGLSADGPEEFALFKEVEIIEERGQVQRDCFLCDGVKFSFLPQPGWRSEASPIKKTITLTTTNLHTVMRLHLPESPAQIPQITPQGIAADAASQKRLNAYLAALKERFPKAKLSRPFPIYAAGNQGIAVDVHRIIGDRFPVTQRFARISIGERQVEFELLAPSSKLREAEHAFRCLLVSFRATEMSISREAPQ